MADREPMRARTAARAYPEGAFESTAIEIELIDKTGHFTDEVTFRLTCVDGKLHIQGSGAMAVHLNSSNTIDLEVKDY